MKSTHELERYLVVLMLAVAAVGCNRDKDTLPDQQVTGQDVKDKYKDALKTTRDYTVQSKDEFMAATDKQIKDLDARIDGLSQKSANLKDDAKAQADKALATLRADRDVLAKKYDDMKQSSQDTWDKTKASFQAAWADVEKAYDDAKAKFSSSPDTSK
ncbi:MAG TPA: hypothetical protein VK731_00135 [Candidatus Cybelea sp.]|jgi:hypothetical protein|nr:hypothetical protein [Candidatus Cybelea sp.]